jgi:hypothetical protein
MSRLHAGAWKEFVIDSVLNQELRPNRQSALWASNSAASRGVGRARSNRRLAHEKVSCARTA